MAFTYLISRTLFLAASLEVSITFLPPMKDFLRLFFAAFWCSVLALSASATFDSIAEAAESEPNNTRAQANLLLFGSDLQASITGRISPLTDLDYFTITANGFTGQATLTVSMIPTSADHGLDARVQLFDAAGA